MPDFLTSIHGQDLGYLRIVGDLWGIGLKSNAMEGVARELAASILDPEQCTELVASLNREATAALTALTASDGRLPWTAFVREFGGVREMGVARREREKPHLKPGSVTEVLFYRALLARAFFDTEKGPQEFAYIPDDLLELLRSIKGTTALKRDAGIHDLAGSALGNAPIGRPALLTEKAHILRSTDRIVDDATSMLAALRGGNEMHADAILQGLLQAAGMLKKNGLRAEGMKTFLEVPRLQALDLLVKSWRTSETFNELRLMPGLVCEGEWTNSPLDAREALMGFLAAIPRNSWWSLNAFVKDMRQKHPDFQRTAGDYDSWFIKRQSDGRYLRGFAFWDDVDGALIRFFIANILYRLGMVDLAVSPDGEDFTAFRFVLPNARISVAETGRLKISSNGMLTVPRSVPRAVRYQIARFCKPEHERPEAYQYRLTAESLTKAKVQGLKIEQILTILSKHAFAGVPPALVEALKRWEAEGTIARAETQVILKVKKPEVLIQLRKSKAARFIGQSLGPTAVVIKPGAQSKVLAALAEMGLLAEDATGEASVASSAGF